MKKCKKCLQEKQITDFSKEAKSFNKDYRRPVCKECRLKEKKEYYDGNSYHREWHLQNKYGMTVEIYNNMFSEQNGKCLVCKQHQSELRQKLCVDHCHKTKKVRGLLCFNCNKTLGNTFDSIDRLKELIKYLERFA